MPFSPLRGRRPGTLLTFLAAVAAVAAFFLVVGLLLPALRGLFTPIYILLALVAVFHTVRWTRPRSGDRRKADRRAHTDES